METIDLQTIIMTLSGLLTGGVLTLAVTLNSQRRKAKASADREEFDLQREIARDNAEKTQKIRELNTEVLSLTKRCHELEMRGMATRCDLSGCLSRKPPLPWMTAEPIDDSL